MGKCESANKKQLNGSFTNNFELINSEVIIDRRNSDTIIRTQIIEGKIKKETFKRIGS